MIKVEDSIYGVNYAINVYSLTDRQTNGRKDALTRTERQADIQVNRQIERQSYKRTVHTNMHRNGQADRQTDGRTEKTDR